MDQTLALFEKLPGRTYAEKGSKTVWAKAEKSGWDKRQAMIQLTVFGDGAMLKPRILFKGKGHLPETELDRYDTRVTVKFNDEGYANEEILLEWIQQQLLPIIHRDNAYDGPISSTTGLPVGIPGKSQQVPGLITLDAPSFHKTQAVLTTVRAANITPSTIPGGCTSLIQVLKVSVNRSFKDYLKEAMDNELHHVVRLERGESLANLDCGEEEILDGPISAVRLRRILLPRSVGSAWEKFGHQKERESITNTFRRYAPIPIIVPLETNQRYIGLVAHFLLMARVTLNFQ